VWRVAYVFGGVLDVGDSVVTGDGDAEGDREETYEGEDGGGSLHVVVGKTGLSDIGV
jgi:hypothetical protein